MNTTDTTPFPSASETQIFERLAASQQLAYNSVDETALDYINKQYGEDLTVTQFRSEVNNRLFDKTSKDDLVFLDAGTSRNVVARKYGFIDWDVLLRFCFAIADPDSLTSRFEQAADAICSGDLASLQSLLDTKPELVKARSMRAHAATLLNYVGANGVENFRQSTPPNIIAITKVLIDAGSDVNAECGAYGVGTTLGLVATSAHPWFAGVQIELLQVLIDAGADIDGPPHHWNPLVSALHNGRGEAARFLAEKGARLDLEGAAGTGMLNAVKEFFDEKGNLKSNATKKQLEDGFRWACAYGHIDVVRFLLDNGINIKVGENEDFTGAHWAVMGAHQELLQLLLERGAPLEALNMYDGTLLSNAFWSITNTRNQERFVPIIEMLLKAGAKIERGWEEWWDRQDVVSPSIKQRVAMLMKEHQANNKVQ